MKKHLDLLVFILLSTVGAILLNAAGMQTGWAIVASVAFQLGMAELKKEFKGSAFSVAPAGDFTCANLVEIFGRAAEMWQDSSISRQYTPKVDSLLYFMQAQQGLVNLEPLKDPMKDNKVRLYWPNLCEGAVTDCTDDCERDGEELSAGCQDYEIGQCKEVRFNIYEKKMRANYFTREEQVARGMMQRIKQLDETIAKYFISVMDANLGVNVNDDYPETSGATEIPAPLWGPGLMGYFAQVADENRFSSPALITGSNLYQQYWAAQKNQGNADGKGDWAMFAGMTVVTDLQNIDSVVGEKATYLYQPAAAALVTKAYYPTTPLEYKQDTRYSVPSLTLPGVYYDVIYSNECIANDIRHSWIFQANFDVFINPMGCDATNNGILKFVCVAP